MTECCFIYRLSCNDKYLGIVAFKDVAKNCFGVVIEWRGDVAFRELGDVSVMTGAKIFGRKELVDVVGWSGVGEVVRRLRWLRLLRDFS